MSGAPPSRLDRRAALLAACAGVAFFSLYATRTCRALSLTGDSAEMVTAAAVWGVPHAPGYPLFTAIAHAFSLLPIDTIPFRVHLTSALFHAAAVGATVLASFTITESLAAALAAGVALGLERSFFAGSLYAEVFPLNDLLFAILLLLALRLRARPSSPLPFGFALGLASAHHMMTALAFPSLAVLVVPRFKREVRDVRAGGLFAVSILLPVLLAYALIPVAAARNPALSSGDVHDMPSLLALITRADYGGLFSSVHGAGHGTQTVRMLSLGGLLLRGFGGATLAFAASGLVALFRRDVALGLAIALAVFVPGPLFAAANALDTTSEATLAFFERFTTMCTVPIAIAFGSGVATFGAALSRLPQARAVGGFAFVAWATVSFVGVKDKDERGNTRGIAFAHDLVLHTPDRSLILLTGDAPANAALYVCAVERACGERIVLSPGGLFADWALSQARRRYPELPLEGAGARGVGRTYELALAEAQVRPVFIYPALFAKDRRLEEHFQPLPDLLLFRLWPKGADLEEAREELLASARAMATGEGCEGCNLALPTSHPSQETQLLQAYGASAANHEQAVREMPEARALLPLLEERAGLFLQRGGESISRNSSSRSR